MNIIKLEEENNNGFFLLSDALSLTIDSFALCEDGVQCSGPFHSKFFVELLKG